MSGSDQTDEKPFQKYDAGKARFDLIPAGSLFAVARVFTFGAVKYAAHNWLKATSWSRYSSAALRHIWAWVGGEKLDPESGEPHLAHAVCCLLMLMELEERGVGEDDRMPRPKAEEDYYCGESGQFADHPFRRR